MAMSNEMLSRMRNSIRHMEEDTDALRQELAQETNASFKFRMERELASLEKVIQSRIAILKKHGYELYACVSPYLGL